MRVTFVLPGHSDRPKGGYLVVFRYANELSRRGHDVTVVHAQQARTPRELRRRVGSEYRFTRKRARIGGGRPVWFKLDPRVRISVLREISDRVPDGDVVFATACTTARGVYELPPTKGTKLYLVQHYEDWLCGRAEVDATWKLPMYKVVSSRWLEEIGIEFGQAGNLTHVPYGVEHEVFGIEVEPEQRNPMRVGMLAHHQPAKGMVYGIEALQTARKQVPELEAVAFGARKRPDALPPWVDYVENPPRHELAALYNTLSVFLHTSITEGWGLTCAEAMACGCALVASDSGGVRDYAVDGQTALLVQPRDPTALATALVRLARDDQFRVRLAAQGYDKIQTFTWERAADRLERLLIDTSSQRQAVR